MAASLRGLRGSGIPANEEDVGSLALAEQALSEAFAVLTGRKVKRISRLWLSGYRTVQEASYWVLPGPPPVVRVCLPGCLRAKTVVSLMLHQAEVTRSTRHR